MREGNARPLHDVVIQQECLIQMEQQTPAPAVAAAVNEDRRYCQHLCQLFIGLASRSL